MYYENELYHHGVKGMRWGIRKLAKDTVQGRISTNLKGRKNLNGYQKMYKKADDYASKQKTGVRVAKGILLGNYGSLTFDVARSHGESKGKAIARALFDINLAGPLASASAAVTPGGTYNPVGFYAGNKAATELTVRKGMAGGLQMRSLAKKYGYR